MSGPQQGGSSRLSRPKMSLMAASRLGSSWGGGNGRSRNAHGEAELLRTPPSAALACLSGARLSICSDVSDGNPNDSAPHDTRCQVLSVMASPCSKPWLPGGPLKRQLGFE
jgi:hypothetical protein